VPGNLHRDGFETVRRRDHRCTLDRCLAECESVAAAKVAAKSLKVAHVLGAEDVANGLLRLSRIEEL
jgi:hypothetical protein